MYGRLNADACTLCIILAQHSIFAVNCFNKLYSIWVDYRIVSYRIVPEFLYPNKLPAPHRQFDFKFKYCLVQVEK